ncbi:hypothetical protein [Paenibacillus sp. Leaf72]|uniref:hypothetical protein n=1 Tax=Paenibacillus sp. Leaf72 TaxID=1736234 RepID=UPI001F220451|nr:hypothetical protein [Paenibacillus sp. Leaf72]
MWNTDLGYEATKKAFEQTCKKLNVDYWDMYLIYFAAPDYLETWRAANQSDCPHIYSCMRYSTVTALY